MPRLSNKKNTQLYNAITRPIMDLRIQLQVSKREDVHVDIDYELFQLEQKIWREVQEVFASESTRS